MAITLVTRLPVSRCPSGPETAARRSAMGITEAARQVPWRDGHRARDVDVRLRDGHSAREHALDGLAVDRLLLASRGIAHRDLRDAVDVAQRAGRVLVE